MMRDFIQLRLLPVALPRTLRVKKAFFSTNDTKCLPEAEDIDLKYLIKSDF